ncbi:unnamed protein product [Spirodela intermedia]|uniref:Receptor-like serine/threonine-protein kinase n=1 Tax=Spirodela intermedia TaxID=51605 RepID=A0A7I8JXJ8_SPIIN|nr:unnamed protein product [Spirodela intermedia]
MWGSAAGAKLHGRGRTARWRGGAAARLRPLLVAATILAVGGLLVGASPEEFFSMASLPLGFELSARHRRVGLSQNGVFAFGFLGELDSDGGGGDGLLVAVWYNVGGGAEKVPVWAAGGGIRVSRGATIRLSADGSLLVFDGRRDGFAVWSSNTANLGVKSASLLGNGNLVLSAGGERSAAAVWESFGSPTNTLLPGQPLRFPQSLRALPSGGGAASSYSLTVTRLGEISLVWEDNVTYWSSGAMNASAAMVEARLQADGVFGLFDAGGATAWFRLSEDFKDPTVALRHLRIDLDGNLRIYSWVAAESSWKISWQAVQNQCDVFGFCGLYSLCGFNSSGPACKCLAVAAAPSSGGCGRIADLGSCGGAAVAMRALENTVLHSLYPPRDAEALMSSEACRRYCLDDSSCIAVTVKNDGSGLCTIKRSSFIAGYSYSAVAATSFLKTCLVPQAVSGMAAAAAQGFHGGAVDSRRRRQDSTAAIALVLLITAGVFLTAELLLFWFVVRRRRRRLDVGDIRRPVSVAEELQVKMLHGDLVRLSIEEVEILTGGFRAKLGPTVFKGFLSHRATVTAKLLTGAVVSEREFLIQVVALSRAGGHQNLVAMKGFSFGSEKKILLYEYVRGCSLDRWLARRRVDRCGGGWRQRMNVAVGVARALRHLHLGCKTSIAHGNLKAANVLIADGDPATKVADYGLQKLRQPAADSSPETLPERDVFMLGVIFLQLVSGRGGAAAGELYSSASRACREGELEGFIDGRLKVCGNGGDGGEGREAVERAMRLALWCMQESPKLRPSIAEVVAVLESSLSLELPPSP